MKTVRTVRNCPVELRFKCPREWDELTRTDEENVRHCSECQENVYFCTTDEETLDHAKAGRCIARAQPHDSELGLIQIGKPLKPHVPSPAEEEAAAIRAREAAIDDALNNIEISTRACPKCNFPAPNWRKYCRVCRYPFGRVKSSPDA